MNEYDDFFRCVRSPDGWEYHVAVVRWHNAYEPYLQWMRFRNWKSKPDAVRRARAKAAALRNDRFFRRCEMCDELSNSGHMFGPDICQGCASSKMGVRF